MTWHPHCRQHMHAGIHVSTPGQLCPRQPVHTRTTPSVLGQSHLYWDNHILGSPSTQDSHVHSTDPKCSPPQLTWLLQETPGRYWHPVCPQIPPRSSSWDPAPPHHHGTPRDGADPDTAGSRPAELHSLKLQKPTPKIFASPPAHTPLPTTSKPPDLEMNHSSAPTWCHYRCHCHCHRCARAPPFTSLPPQRGQDPHAAPDLQKAPATVPIPAPGGDGHSCPPRSCGDTHRR